VEKLVGGKEETENEKNTAKGVIKQPKEKQVWTGKIKVEDNKNRSSNKS